MPDAYLAKDISSKTLRASVPPGVRAPLVCSAPLLLHARIAVIIKQLKCIPYHNFDRHRVFSAVGA